MQSFILYGFSDGASRGNPGKSGIGIVLETPAGENLLAEEEFIGMATNNEAEYLALIKLLKRARNFPCSQLIVHLDSQLITYQMSGKYQVKTPSLLSLYNDAKEALSLMPFPVDIIHIPRELNSKADRLANKAIDQESI